MGVGETADEYVGGINEEAYSVYGDPAKDMVISARTLQWLRSIERTEEERPVKREVAICGGGGIQEQEGGRPRRKLRDVVIADFERQTRYRMEH